MESWSVWPIVLLIIFVIATVQGIRESAPGKLPSSSFWFWCMVGIAILVTYTPLSGLFD